MKILDAGAAGSGGFGLDHDGLEAKGLAGVEVAQEGSHINCGFRERPFGCRRFGRKPIRDIDTAGVYKAANTRPAGREAVAST